MAMAKSLAKPWDGASVTLAPTWTSNVDFPVMIGRGFPAERPSHTHFSHSAPGMAFATFGSIIPGPEKKDLLTLYVCDSAFFKDLMRRSLLTAVTSLVMSKHSSSFVANKET